MNKQYLLLGIILLAMPVYAKVGTHNFLLRAGGGFNLNARQYTRGAVSENEFQATKEQLRGVLMSVDMGYQYFHNSSDKTVQGVNVLAGFGYGISELIYKGNKIVQVPAGIGTQVYHLRMYGSLSSTYSIGRQFLKSKLMFDIAGLQMTFGDFTFQFNVPAPPITMWDINNFETIKRNVGTVFGIGFALPLGFHYIMNNGFTIGLSHAINFLLPVTNGENNLHALKESNRRVVDYISYNVQFSIGFIIGN